MRRMTRRLITHLLLSGALLAAPLAAKAQVEAQSMTAVMGRSQPFHFDALNFALQTEFGLQSRMDVYAHIPFDIITFVKKEDAYVGSYAITLIVSDESGARIKEESWDRKIEKTAFESTVSPGAYDLTQRSISLPQGPAVLEMLYEDRASRKEYRLSRKIESRRFDANLFALSDMMIVSRVDARDGRRHITPHVDPNVAALDQGFNVFFEAYNPLLLDKVRISYIVQRRGQIMLSNAEVQPIKQGASSFLTRVGTSALPIGPYTISIIASRLDDSTATGILAQTTRSFTVEWLSSGAPIAIADLDDAIDQLRYFARSADISHIRDAEDETERRRRFEEFWEKNNPTPGTQPNRAMVEYYSRVAYANERFKHYIDGWKTDRGMVYIIYGQPSYVDRHPLDVESKPYEIWEYYDIQRRFIFVDESGFGDYRLLYPIWDDRNRLR
jgi:GWxTD domain-containing protein